MKSKWTMFWPFSVHVPLLKALTSPSNNISSLRTCLLTWVRKVWSQLPFQLLNVLRDSSYISVYTLTYCFWFNCVFNITSDPYYLKRSSECFDKITWAKKVDEGVQAAVDSCQYIACIICCLQLQQKSTFTGIILFHNYSDSPNNIERKKAKAKYEYTYPYHPHRLILDWLALSRIYVNAGHWARQATVAKH